MVFRWIHLSDFHFEDTKDLYELNTVLQPLLDEIQRRREKEGFQADAVFVTGDIAYSGKPKEYQPATRFFDDLLRVAGLDKSRLFIVPGNHDADKTASVGLDRSLKSEAESTAYFARGKPKYHFEKFKEFKKWYDGYFKEVKRTCPKDNTLHKLECFDSNGLNIAVLALNTALFSKPGKLDHNALWIGRRNVDAAVKELNQANPDLCFALLHHPLDWLHDEERTQVKSALQERADFLLRGHLHKNEIDLVVNTHGGCFHLAAGACYQAGEYPKTALFCTADLDKGELEILPIHYVDDPKPKWVLDTSLFDPEDNHIGRFQIPKLELIKPPDDMLDETEVVSSITLTEKAAPQPVNIEDVDPALLNMVLGILAKSDTASRQLAKALNVRHESIEDCREKVAKTAVMTPLETLFDIALDCQVALRMDNPPQKQAASLIARFMEAVLPAQDSARDPNHQTSGQDEPFELLASRATLAEIRLASRDKRPAQFLFDEKGNLKGGKGQLDQGEGWETGRDKNWEQFEKDVTNYLVEQFETYFGEDWRYLKKKSFRESFEQHKWTASAKEDQELTELIHKVMVKNANKSAREIRMQGFNCDSFTFYFLIKTPSWITPEEKSKQDAVLDRVRKRFPGIAFLRLAPETDQSAIDLVPFLNLHELLNPNEDDR